MIITYGAAPTVPTLTTEEVYLGLLIQLVE